ncbi:hypothetical protein GALMADRAFT_1353446, partial [Galerina marginata CBS 339.88]
MPEYPPEPTAAGATTSNEPAISVPSSPTATQLENEGAAGGAEDHVNANSTRKPATSPARSSTVATPPPTPSAIHEEPTYRVLKPSATMSDTEMDEASSSEDEPLAPFTPRPQAPPPPAETSDTTFNNLRSLIATIMRNRGQNSQDPPQTAHDEADDEDLEVPPLSLAEGTDDGHTTIASSDNGHVANTNTNDNDSDGSMPGLQSVSDTDSGDESDDSTTSRRATRPPKVLAAAADLGDPVWDFGLYKTDR